MNDSDFEKFQESVKRSINALVTAGREIKKVEGEVEKWLDQCQAAFIDLLGNRMSQISREWYLASWMAGLEETIPYSVKVILARETPLSGHVFLPMPLRDALGLYTLSNVAGGWVTLAEDGNGYVLYEPECLKEQK